MYQQGNISNGVVRNFQYFLWVNLASDDSDGSIISKPWNGSGQYNYRIYNGSDNIGVDILGTTAYSLELQR